MSSPEAQNFDSSRLPAQRSSFLERYHLYNQRTATRCTQDRLMVRTTRLLVLSPPTGPLPVQVTVDHRFKPQSSLEEGTTVLTPPSKARCRGKRHREDPAIEEDVPILGTEDEDEDTAPDERLVRGKLAVALAALPQHLALQVRDEIGYPWFPRRG
ncbi:hypothetical protein C8T65DRAFT_735545 [Cerioporus squamosus]|nr:hypothetical protein C8T65DRAFT_735545 [Cerioporus squamosus]